MIKLSPTSLPGVVIVEPRVFSDERGFFTENFNARDFEEAGLPTDFVQDNHSRSVRGVLRGLHYQYPAWQGKLRAFSPVKFSMLHWIYGDHL